MTSRLLFLLLLLVCSATARAAPGFISSGVVERGGVYAEVTLKLSCNVHYIGHVPRDRSDVLRIQLESTTVCPGASPGIGETNQIFRPQGADLAGLGSVEYSGETAGDQHLLLSFNEEVRFDVRQVKTNRCSIRTSSTGSNGSMESSPRSSAGTGGTGPRTARDDRPSRGSGRPHPSCTSASSIPRPRPVAGSRSRAGSPTRRTPSRPASRLIISGLDTSAHR